jgi:hypothetical protein
MTGQMKEKLEQSADCRFEKAPDGYSHTCYIGHELVADKRTLGECVWAAAEELGENGRA